MTQHCFEERLAEARRSGQREGIEASANFLTNEAIRAKDNDLPIIKRVVGDLQALKSTLE